MKRIPLSLLAVVVGVSAATAAHAQTFNIVTTPAGSFTNSIGAAVAKALDEKAGIRAVVTPQQSLGLSDVDAGLAEFAFSTIHDLSFAVAGAREYQSHGPHENLRVVAKMTPLRAAIFVRKGSDIRTLADLKGQRIACTYGAQPSGNVTAAGFRAAAGLTEDDVECVQARNIPGAADDFAAGRSDAFYFAVGSGKVKEVSAAVGGLRILPFPTDPEIVAKVTELIPGAYPFTEQPSPAVEEIDEPTPVMAYDLAMFTNKDIAEELVYRVAEALHDSKDGLVAVFPGLRLFDPQTLAPQYESLEYHPGAVKFYQEKDIWDAAAR